jgi:hypothetical protein
MRNIIVFVLTLVFLTTRLLAQNTTPTELLNRDYPVLAKEFNDKLVKQNATYVFAIDFSTSMKALERDVKRNVEMFINSLPNGDRISLIKEGKTENTDYIYLPNAVISNESKKAIIESLNSTPFSENESDGYRLTQKILEAINQTGGNELIYIFIFTDFEFYNRQYGFDKDKCDWESLKKQFFGISQGKKIVKVGLELPASNLKQSAIFKPELDAIFGGVQYFKIIDGSSLASWFNDTRANILRDRLNLIVHKEIDAEIEETRFNLKPVKDSAPTTWIENDDMKLIQNFSLVEGDELTKVIKPIFENPFSKTKNENAQVQLIYSDNYKHAKGYNEIEKMLQEPMIKEVSIATHQPKAYVSWQVSLALTLLLLALLVCLILTYLTPKKFSSIRVYAELSGKENKTDSKRFTDTKRIVIGKPIKKVPATFVIEDTSKTIEVFVKHNFPCRLWIKPGVYIRAIKGSGIKYTLASKKGTGALAQGSVKHLSKLKSFYGVNITFEEDGTAFSIRLVLM